MRKLLFLIFIFFVIICIGKTLLGVAEEWPPFEYRAERNGKFYDSGVDLEIIREVLKKMGYELKVIWLPWARCFMWIQEKKADLIFTASKTPEREKFLYYPNEPLTYTTVVLFYRKSDNFKSFKEIEGLKVAYVPSYYYGERFFKLPLTFVPVKDVLTGFKLLMFKRVDLVVADVNVGINWAKRFGMVDKVDYIKEPIWGPDPQYVAFAKKEGYKELVEEFSRILKEYKKTKEYEAILEKYGIIKIGW